MNYKNNKKHITALMAAMAVAGTSSAFAELVEDTQTGVVYVSAIDTIGDNAQIRFGQNSTTGGGGAAENNSTIASLTTADPQINLVFTPLNNVNPTLTNETKGGLLIDPATGNTTVKQASTAIDTILPGLVRVRQQEVWSNDPSVPEADRGVATGTPASTVYGTLIGTTFTPLELSAATQDAIEFFVADPSADNAKALMDSINNPDNINSLGDKDSKTLAYSAGAPVTVAGTGNFAVEGSTSTNGITNTGAISTGTLSTSGAATLNSAVVTNNATVGGTLRITGATTTNGITNTGNISTGTLNVSGLSTLATANITTANVTTANLTTANITTANVTTANVTNLAVSGNATFTSRPTVGGAYVAPIDTDPKNQVALTGDVLAEAAARANEDSVLLGKIDAVDRKVGSGNVLSAIPDRYTPAERQNLTNAVNAVDQRVVKVEDRATALEGRMGRAESDIRSLRKGVAMSAALQTPVINDGDKQAVKVGAATYDGEQGLGLGYARRVNDSVTVNVDVATGFPETVARGGVNLSF